MNLKEGSMKFCRVPTLAITVLAVFSAHSYGGFKFPAEGQILTNTTTAPDSTFAGVPDSVPESGAGTTWGGLGNGVVLYDFGTINNADLLLQDGAGILNRAGFDISIYEANGGAAESNLIRVEVSDDQVDWTDVSSTRNTVAVLEVPQKDHPQQYTSSYDIAAHGAVARYLRITGTSAQPPGQTPTAGNGFDLDAVAVAASPRMDFHRPLNPLSRVERAFDSVLLDDGTQLAITGDGSGSGGATFVKLMGRDALGEEAFETLASLEYPASLDVRIIDARIAAGGGRIWACFSFVSSLFGDRAELVVASVTLNPSGVWTIGSEDSLRAPDGSSFYQEGTFDLVVNDEGEPIILAAGGVDQSFVRHLNFVGPGPVAWTQHGFNTAFPAVILGSGTDSSPSLAIDSDGEVVVGMANVSIVDISVNSSYESVIRLMRVGFNGTTGGIERPDYAASTTSTVAADTRVGDGAQAFVDLDVDVSSGGKLAAVWRERVDRRMKLVCQTTAGDAAAFDFYDVPSSLEGGLSAQVAWRSEDSIVLAYLVEFPESDPYAVVGSFDKTRELWDFRRVLGDASNLSMDLTADGAPLLAYPIPLGSEFRARAVIPLDMTDFDGDGSLLIEEEAGVAVGDSYPRFSLIDDAGDQFPEIVFLAPLDGVFYRDNVYTTPDLRYEVELGVQTGAFSDSFMEVGPGSSGAANRIVRFRSRLSADFIPAQYMRVRVSRP